MTEDPWTTFSEALLQQSYFSKIFPEGFSFATNTNLLWSQSSYGLFSINDTESCSDYCRTFCGWMISDNIVLQTEVEEPSGKKICYVAPQITGLFSVEIFSNKLQKHHHNFGAFIIFKKM